MDLNKYIRDIENFPIEGVTFKDITPLLSSPDAFNFSIEEFGKLLNGTDKIVALDARGFIFGGALCSKYNIPFVPIRKAGKLPYETISIDYELEYGKNTFEIHKDAILPGEKVFIIDDLLATGGTAKAACDLVEQLGGVVDSVNFLVNLKFLKGEDKLTNYKINSLLEY